jgi:predicted amidophosphoribosyltransferase
MFLDHRCPLCGGVETSCCCVSSARPARAGASSAWEYGGSARALILGLKYRNSRRTADVLAAGMVARVGAGAFDVVTWAPTSAGRVARRGYDPAELLARALAFRLGLPCRRLLRRSPDSTPQAGKDRRARLVGPQFIARPLRGPLRILLVDDVVTTGATLRQAAAALEAAGAVRVDCLTAAAA